MTQIRHIKVAALLATFFVLRLLGAGGANADEVDLREADRRVGLMHMKSAPVDPPIYIDFSSTKVGIIWGNAAVTAVGTGNLASGTSVTLSHLSDTEFFVRGDRVEQFYVTWNKAIAAYEGPGTVRVRTSKNCPIHTIQAKFTVKIRTTDPFKGAWAVIDEEWTGFKEDAHCHIIPGSQVHQTTSLSRRFTTVEFQAALLSAKARWLDDKSQIAHQLNRLKEVLPSLPPVSKDAAAKVIESHRRRITRVDGLFADTAKAMVLGGRVDNVEYKASKPLEEPDEGLASEVANLYYTAFDVLPDVIVDLTKEVDRYKSQAEAPGAEHGSDQKG